MPHSTVPEPPAVTAEQVLARLEACCVSVGYLTDTARFEQKDQLQAEVPKLVGMLRGIDEQAEDKLLDLAAGHANPWVRYFTAIHIAVERPVEVAAILGRLIEEPGLVAAAATLAQHQLQPKAIGTAPPLH